jgi:hypothetical protein
LLGLLLVCVVWLLVAGWGVNRPPVRPSTTPCAFETRIPYELTDSAVAARTAVVAKRRTEVRRALAMVTDECRGYQGMGKRSYQGDGVSIGVSKGSVRK